MCVLYDGNSGKLNRKWFYGEARGLLKTLCGFSMGRNHYLAGRVYDLCVYYHITGTPEGSTESGFMEKPGIEPATPGL